MKKTEVVNIRSGRSTKYIGRGSPFGNPYKIGRDGTREEVIEKFRKYFMSKPELQQMVRDELQGERLGCYCKPLPCHGDVFVEYLDSLE